MSIRRQALQRGRTHTSAEIKLPSPETGVLDALQRGRTHTSAEIGHPEVGGHEGITASTGPHSHERGNVKVMVRVMVRVRLQRGRTHTSAEIPAWRSPSPGPSQ